MTALTTAGRAHGGPGVNKVHMPESLLTELVRRWVPEDEVGDAHGGDGTLGPETKGRDSN